MTEVPVYYPIEEHPWPESEGWLVAWWSDQYGQWCSWRAFGTKQEALDRVNAMRAQDPDQPYRLVRETRIYTAEEE